MGVQQELWLDADDNIEKWEDGLLKASDRRILLTRWLADAIDAVHKKRSAMWRYFERTGSIITVDGTRREALTPGGEIGYTIGPRPAFYATLRSITRSEEVMASAIKPITPEPEISSDLDDTTLQELQDHFDEGKDFVLDDALSSAVERSAAADADGRMEKEVIGGGKACDAGTVEESQDVESDVPVPTLKDILGRGFVVNAAETSLETGDAIAFNWGDAGYSLGVLVHKARRNTRRRGFNWFVKHDGERHPRTHMLSLSTMRADGPSGTWVALKKA